MVTETLRHDTAARAVRALVAIGLAAVAAFAVGLAFEKALAWAALLHAGVYVATLGAGAAFFVALQHVAGAGWSTVFRRIPEGLSAVIPGGAILLAPVVFGLHALYPWAQHSGGHHNPHPGWFNVPAFALRAALYLALWTLLATALRRTSIAQDADGALAHTKRNVKLGIAYILVFGLSFSAASFDWLMALEHEWVSTIFGVYNFAGAFQAAIALIVVVAVLFRRAGVMKQVTVSHLHDLGRLLFGFSAFWAYIWFSQAMLIWYANIPEEVTWYLHRTEHGWAIPFWCVPLLNFVVPFFVLLPRASKRSESVLLHAAAIVLLGRWLDLYVMIFPAASHDGPTLGISNLAATVLGAVVVVLMAGRAFLAAPLVPRRDPYLEESVNHHVSTTI